MPARFPRSPKPDVRGWPSARLALLLAVVSLPAVPASGQDGGAPPERVEPRRLSFGLEASASYEPEDTGFFNYADYGHSALRLARVRGDAALALGRRASALASVRADTGDGLRLFAAYLRLRPWPERALDLQLGRIPPSFGAFGRRGYGAENPLVGYPLGYQYLTSLRTDAVPGRADDLLRMRGRGWRSSFPVGSGYADVGLPLVAADRWDTGLQLRVGAEPLSLAVSWTLGSLSNPRGISDDNAGKQVSGRIELRPRPGLVLGVSAAHGAYLGRDVTGALGPTFAKRSFPQRALGLDLEYAQGYWILRGEAVVSDWRLPELDPSLPARVGAAAVSVEARYKVRPQLYLAARVDRLGFSEVTGSLFGGKAKPWDAPVSRVEAGAGYKVRRNLLLKAVYQQNWRDTTVFHRLGVAAAQILLWL